jgi:predicted transcriptional regulator
MSNAINLPQTMLKRLEKISAVSRRTTGAIVKQAIAEKLDYEEWVIEQIDAGLADVKAGRVLSDEAFWKQLGNPRHGRKKAA